MDSRPPDQLEARADLPPQQRSPWAIASLLCAIGIACPLLAVLAPILGLKALAHIRSTPGMGGMKTAVAGIAIGLLGIVLWTSIAFWWHTEGRSRMLDGPRIELQHGQAGDIATFKAGFTEPGASLSDDVAAAFLAELFRRYGRLTGTQQDHFRPDPEPGRMSPVIPYVLHFEVGLVQAEAKLVLFAEGFSPKWEYIVILDDEAGDLSYPPGIERLPPGSAPAEGAPAAESPHGSGPGAGP